MNPKRVNQAEIARQANVHITTVSLALRDSPRLPESTKERITALARELGYRPDPMLTALNAYRRNVKLKQHHGTLAWVAWSASDHDAEYRRGAQERCAELGYKLDGFSLAATRAAHLSEILRTRNIQGLLFAPQNRNRAHLNLTWHEFASVTFGYTLVHPQLHMVTNAQYRSARTCMRALRSIRYRRIGFVTTHNSDERTDQNFSSGYYAEQARLKEAARIPMLLLKDSDSWAEQETEFGGWYQQYRPDALMVHYSEVPKFMRSLGISFEECGVATLTRSNKENDLAGICQNNRIVGRTAVDFLVSRIHLNERGIPEVPLRTLVQGTWHNGDSVRQRVVKRSGA